MINKVLIIATNLIVGEHIKNFLIKEGFEVHIHVYTSKNQSDIYLHRDVDYLIVDNVSILSVVELFREKLEKKECKIINLNITDLSEDLEVLKSSDSIFFIEKPFLPSEILNYIN